MDKLHKEWINRINNDCDPVTNIPKRESIVLVKCVKCGTEVFLNKDEFQELHRNIIPSFICEECE